MSEPDHLGVLVFGLVLEAHSHHVVFVDESVGGLLLEDG